MSSEKAAASQASEEEINEIMDELEKLKTEMSEARKDEESSSDSPSEPKAENRPNLTVVPDPVEEELPSEEPKMEDFHSSSDEPSMEDTIGHYKGEETEDPNGLLNQPSGESQMEDAAEFSEDFDSFESEDQTHSENPAASSSEEGSLSLNLKGNLNLKLQYEKHGQEVSVRFADETMIVTLSSGAEFKIPMK